MAFGATGAILLLLTFTLTSASNPDLVKCRDDHAVPSTYFDGLAVCLNVAECPLKSCLTVFGWLNENSEPFNDEETLAANMNSVALADVDIARLYARGFFKAGCNNLLADINGCKTYDYFHACATQAGCYFALHSDYADFTGFSDIQFWIDSEMSNATVYTDVITPD